jgi:hypothetical protein
MLKKLKGFFNHFLLHSTPGEDRSGISRVNRNNFSLFHQPLACFMTQTNNIDCLTS